MSGCFGTIRRGGKVPHRIKAIQYKEEGMLVEWKDEASVCTVVRKEGLHFSNWDDEPLAEEVLRGFWLLLVSLKKKIWHLHLHILFN